MKKKILSLLAAIAMLACTSTAVMADKENNSPDVYVDGEIVKFADQKAVIMNDFTMIPVRGVFNAMGARVDWDGETQTVTINSRNNMIRVKLTIGSDVMTVYNFIDVLSAEETKVTLDAPPVIINDNETYRTLIPLRAISESLKSDVKWDGESFAVYITTPDIEKIENKAALSLSADKAEVAEGDELALYIDLKNLASYPGNFVSGVTASVKYDKENFEFVKAYLCDEKGEQVSGDTGADNADYTEDSLKTVHITINSETAIKADDSVLKLIFKAKNTKPSTFVLMNRYNTQIGHDTSLQLTNSDLVITQLSGNQLTIDQTPVIVNAEAAEK